jgi:hypothetical protein
MQSLQTPPVVRTPEQKAELRPVLQQMLENIGKFDIKQQPDDGTDWMLYGLIGVAALIVFVRLR